MKLHEFLMRTKTTASIKTVDGSIVVIFDESINGNEIIVYCEGIIIDAAFYCESVSVTVDGFDNIDEIEMPEYPETIVSNFVNEWFSDDILE